MKEDGRREVSERELLNAVKALGPKATTPEIAERVGLTPQGAGYRLRNLEKEGKVESEKVGRSKMWSRKSGHVGPIVFSDESARSQLVNQGKVVTFRSDQRTTGKTHWRTGRTGTKQGDVIVTEIEKVDPQNDGEIEPYRPLSGFDTVTEWKESIKNMSDDVTYGHLYLVVTVP
jgi:DNA-binding Lrp family transcriptional regulator